MTQTNQLVYEVTRSLVSTHFAEETSFVEASVEAALSIVPARVWLAPDEFDRREGRILYSGLPAIDAGASGGIDSFFVAAAILGCVAQLRTRRLEDKTLIDQASIVDALNELSNVLGAPAEVREVLRVHAVPLLAEHLHAIDAGGASEPIADLQALHVEWRSTADSSSPQIERILRSEVRERFERRQSEFDIYFDESAGGMMYLNGEPVDTHGASTEARFVLYLLLRALGHSGQVRFEEFSGVSPLSDPTTADDIKRIKHRANKALGGILNRGLVASRGADKYMVQELSYCWIRYGSTDSVLIP